MACIFCSLSSLPFKKSGNEPVSNVASNFSEACPTDPCKLKLNQANSMYDVDSNTQTDKKLLRKLRHASEQYTFKTEYTSLYFPTLCTFCYLNSADLLGPTSLKFVEPHL